MKRSKKIFLTILFAMLAACSSLKIAPVNYAWPLENVLEIRSDFNVASMRYSVTMNLRELFEAEKLIENNAPVSKQVRIIRNRDGYYFITANKFKHVYVFAPGEKSLVLKRKITINEKGIENPAFNQRGDYIELITDNGNKRYELTQDGVK
jgi:hypothetical protein